MHQMKFRVRKTLMLAKTCAYLSRFCNIFIQFNSLREPKCWNHYKRHIFVQSVKKTHEQNNKNDWLFKREFLIDFTHLNPLTG